jgi:hypothetical protein
MGIKLINRFQENVVSMYVKCVKTAFYKFLNCC